MVLSVTWKIMDWHIKDMLLEYKWWKQIVAADNLSFFEETTRIKLLVELVPPR